MTDLRQDIQFLRGYAVSIVILEHAGFWPSAGYLGVDIFFVISGYLITRMIQEQLQQGRFNFVDFYFRRAKRLLPAAYVTFALTALAAPYFLGVNELTAFKDQLLGAVTFSANFVLWDQTGYFDTDAAMKPLLHIWSLSLEEQFYFILPTILLVVRMRYWVHIAITLLIASGALCIYLMLYQPDAAFFLLPSRAWELTIGSLIALMRLDAVRPASLFRWAFWPSLATVILLPFLPTGYPHPGLDAVLMCLATAVIIINRRAFLGASVTTNWLAWIGNPSYSLYLVHWPIISFAHNAYIGEMTLEVRLTLIALSAAGGLALYYGVERPLHRLQHLPKIPSMAAATALAAGLALSPYLLPSPAQSAGGIDYAEAKAPNYGLAVACDQGATFRPLKECQTGDAPNVLIWGDSFAKHLVPGIVASTDLPVQQATRSSCPPVLGYAQFDNATRYNEDWASRCVQFNRHVFNNLRASETIETVVIASAFRAFTFKTPWQSTVYRRDGTYEVRAISEQQSVRALANTIKSIRSLGKRVVLVAPPPSSGQDIGSCSERLATGLLVFGKAGCEISRADDARTYAAEMRLLALISKQENVTMVDPRSWLCTTDTCATTMGGTPLYRDGSHLSKPGSEALGRQYRIADELIGKAL